MRIAKLTQTPTFVARAECRGTVVARSLKM
jgi:hypothetical protein